MTLHHRPEPGSLHGDRKVPSLPKRSLPLSELGAKTWREGSPLNVKLALSGRCADGREAQKVEAFRFTLAPLASALLCEAAEFDPASLLRVQFQAKLGTLLLDSGVLCFDIARGSQLTKSRLVTLSSARHRRIQTPLKDVDTSRQYQGVQQLWVFGTDRADPKSPCATWMPQGRYTLSGAGAQKSGSSPPRRPGFSWASAPTCGSRQTLSAASATSHPHLRWCTRSHKYWRRQ